MLIRAPEKYGVSICTIISDNNSNGRAKVRQITNGGLLPAAVDEGSIPLEKGVCQIYLQLGFHS
jgi:hypothetical protein